MNPKVSIIIPVYNGANFLEEAILSAINQTYVNTEIIVVNDGSNDGGDSERIALKHQDKIRYFYKENGGVASALNFGIRQMTGEYFSWLSHDDLYMPQKIEKQINLLNKKQLTQPALIYSDFYEINSKGKVTYAVFPSKKYKENSLYLLSNHKINGCSLLIPKKCFEETGYFDENLRSTQDYDLWFRMRTKYKFIHVNEFLVKSRLHEQQGSITIDNHNAEQSKLHIEILSKLDLREIEQSGFEPSDFYLCRSARLKKEALTEASEYAFKKYLDIIDSKGLKRKKLKEKYLSIINNKSVSALLYFLRLMFNPLRWGVLFYIIKGRLF